MISRDAALGGQLWTVSHIHIAILDLRDLLPQDMVILHVAGDKPSCYTRSPHQFFRHDQAQGHQSWLRVLQPGNP